MKRRLEGRKYFFDVTLEEGGNISLFEIKAICKTTRRFSCINNLNVVLAELGVDSSNQDYDDSSWTIDIRIATRCFETANSFLSDSQFLPYIENCLDEDRSYGEWENVMVDLK